ncbi:MAG TPA: hypothetical protein VOA41_03530 [Candidatus Dormibacteraeota bacterium]|nr:hypothetical protein [Candidatus Dormibacteraeota bacterium]
MSAAIGRYLTRRFFSYALMIAVLLAVRPWLWQGVRDAYVGYSGTVVAKGDYLWIPFRGPDWYIILQDSHGRRTKRYVSAIGYGYCNVGSYVVKKKGLGEFPRTPGDLTPREFEQLVRRKQKQK